MKGVVKKSELLNKLKRLIKHRERMMKIHGARKTLDRLTIVSKLLNICEMNKNSNEQTIARVILLQEQSIRRLMPGRISQFYESDYRKLNEILDQCKNTLKLTTN